MQYTPYSPKKKNNNSPIMILSGASVGVGFDVKIANPRIADMPNKISHGSAARFYGAFARVMIAGVSEIAPDILVPMIASRIGDDS
jgi:hypothetical protein